MSIKSAITVNEATVGVPKLPCVIDDMVVASALYASSCGNYAKNWYTVGVSCRLGVDLASLKEGYSNLPWADGKSAEVACCIPEKEVYAVLRNTDTESKVANGMVRSAAEEFVSLIESCGPICDCCDLRDVLYRFDRELDGCPVAMSVVSVLKRNMELMQLAYAYVGDSGIYCITDSGLKRITDMYAARTTVEVLGSGSPLENRKNHVRWGTCYMGRGEAVAIVTDGVVYNSIWSKREEIFEEACSSRDAMTVAENIVKRSPVSPKERTVIVIKA